VTVRTFPHIGADPTPGDVDGTRVLSGTLADLAHGLGDTADRLRRIDAGEWRGRAARAFVDQTHEDLLPLVERAQASFDEGRTALVRWAEELAGFQAEAQALEQEAATAAAALTAATTDRDAPRIVDPETAGDVRARLEGAVEGAQADLAGVRSRATALHERYLSAADVVAEAVERAADRALEQSLWQRVADTVADGWEKTWDWVKEHADDFAAVGDALSTISGVLTALAIITAGIPPVGAIFGAAALVTAGGALAAHGIAKAAGADVSWTTIGLDALGILPGFKAATAFVKGAKVTGEAAEAGAKALGSAWKMAGTVQDTSGAAVPVVASVFTKVGISTNSPGLLGKAATAVSKETPSFTVKPGSFMDRTKSAAAALDQNLLAGQTVGTKGWNAAAELVGKKVPAAANLVIDTTSQAAKVIDHHVKLTTLVVGKAVAAADPREPRPSDPFVAGLAAAAR